VAGLSFATCLKEKPVCENMPGLATRAVRLAAEGRSRDEITQALTFEKPWAKVEAGSSPSRGPADAPVTIIEFTDFQCPFCARSQKPLAEVEEKYGDRVRVVFKNYPLGMHKMAKPAAAAAVAAGLQGKFWPYQALLFERQKDLSKEGFFEGLAGELGLDAARLRKDLESPAVEQQIQADMAQAQRLGVHSTPTFYVNGYKLKGARPFEAFSRIIDAELQDRGLR
jgi:protein-disulfide isomerase